MNASLSLYFSTFSPSMPRTCISALPEPASQSVSRPPLHASIYRLMCLSLLFFLSFSLPVISLCTFFLDIVRLAASLCFHFPSGIQVSGFLWFMLCVCLLSFACPCFCLLFCPLGIKHFPHGWWYGHLKFSAHHPNDKRALCWVPFNNLDEVWLSDTSGFHLDSHRTVTLSVGMRDSDWPGFGLEHNSLS